MTQVKLSIRSAYLAGPMRGYEKYNFPAFHAAAAQLRDANWQIFSPAERDEADPAIDHEENVAGWSGSRGLDYFMAHDLKAVCEMDAVICLPGWEESQGARLETVTAVEIGHPVFVMPGAGTDDWQLQSVDPDYIQAVFHQRGVPKHVLGPDCWCMPEREDYSQGAMLTPPEVIAQMERESWEESRPEPEVTKPYDPLGCGHGPLERLEKMAGWDGVKEDAKVASALPTDSAGRKAVPLASGVLDYFPAALAEIARVSKAGNDKHNPGQPMHHARAKSTDHADCLLRHLVDRGKTDPETGQRHSAEVAWRALALLQQELEDAGLAPLPRGAKL